MEGAARLPNDLQRGMIVFMWIRQDCSPPADTSTGRRPQSARPVSKDRAAPEPQRNRSHHMGRGARPASLVALL
jgi:hypothetical protein